jgi:HemY protein
LHAWHSQRKSKQALASYERGVLALSQGNWGNAERDFIRHIRYSKMPMVNYLFAARAAQSMGAIDKRDQYLHLAHDTDEKEATAVALTQAELQIEQNQFEQALTALKQIHEKDSRNGYALILMVKIYKKLNDWPSLFELLPVLKKRQVFSHEEYADLEHSCYRKILESYPADKDFTELKKLWQSAPKSLREDTGMIKLYCTKAINLNQSGEVEAILRQFLKKNFDEDIVELYGQLDIDPVVKQISLVESLAQQYPTNPVILLTLGRLCLKNKLWGRARNYFESSIGAGTSTEAYKELADLLTQLGEKDTALEYYKAGMSLAMQKAS